MDTTRKDYNNIAKDKLREYVKSHAFITSQEANIVGKNGLGGNWIFDIKNILLESEVLDWIVDIFWNKFEDEYPFQVGGLETTAIPIVAAIVLSSHKRGKPVNGFYIRKSKKKDGLQKDIEGGVEKDKKIILVDDILNSGKSIGRQLRVLDDHGHKVHSVFALVNFREVGHYEFLTERGIHVAPVYSIKEFGREYITDKGDVPYNHFEELWCFSSLNHDAFHVFYKSSPILDGGNIYFGSDQGIFWALRQKDGSVAWKKRIGFFKAKGIFSSPAILNEKIFFGGYDGNFYCLNKSNGSVKWIFMEADWIGSSPCVAEDLNMVFIGLEFAGMKNKGGITALDVETGRVIWRYGMPELTHASPAYCSWKGTVFCGDNDGAMYCFDAKSGKLKWRHQTGDPIRLSCVFDKKRNLVIFGSFDKYLYFLDLDNGKLVFRFGCMEAIASNQVIEDNDIFFSSLDKCIYSLNLDTFKLNWRYMTNGRVFSTPSIIEGNVFVGSNDGRMYELDKNTGKILSTYQASERVINRVAYDSDSKRFFLSTNSNQVVCLIRQKFADRFIGKEE